MADFTVVMRGGLPYVPDGRRAYEVQCPQCGDVFYSCKSLAHESGLNRGSGRCDECNAYLFLEMVPDINGDAMKAELYDVWLARYQSEHVLQEAAAAQEPVHQPSDLLKLPETPREAWEFMRENGVAYLATTMGTGEAKPFFAVIYVRGIEEVSSLMAVAEPLSDGWAKSAPPAPLGWDFDGGELEAIARLSAALRWISVDERLPPEDHKWYLPVIIEGGAVGCAFFVSGEWIHAFSRKTVFGQGGMPRVVKWFQLPADQSEEVRPDGEGTATCEIKIPARRETAPEGESEAAEAPAADPVL